ncbi:MAG: hypothetical protein JWN98_2067 [Abditibacteriota bacterium]|nr:hypothetical protein [Abditibacteriota bacterium]
MISGRDADRLASIGRSKDRLASVRQRRTRQRRGLWGWVLLLVAGAGAWQYVVRSTPAPPVLIVTWPKPKIHQTVSNGSTLLARRGSSFEVTVSDAERWDMQWADGNTRGPGAKWTWKLNNEKSTLTATCRGVGQGWRRLVAFFWPAQELTLHAQAATSLGGFRYSIVPPKGGLWLYPLTYAKTPVAWDERSLQLLSMPILPALDGLLSLSTPQTSTAVLTTGAAANTTPAPTSRKGTPLPDQPMWWIVPSFSPDPKTKSVKGDIGTYAKLNSKQLEDDMLRLAPLLAEQKPESSLKFMVRLDSRPPQGVIRIAFDGKRERKGWIRRPGEPNGPLIWDEDPDNGPSIVPSLP